MSVIPFVLWPQQVAVMWRLMTERLVIILKARQLGISWLVCAYALWLCFFQDGKVVLLFSKGQLEANELTRRILALYQQLPDWMRAAGPALTTQNMSELGWANGSRIQSLPATQNAGRSFTASLVVLDEAAFLHYATELYTALRPTIDAGGQMIILSTANGTGNLFYDMWQNAVKGLNRFAPIFLSWRARPERTDAWRAQVEADAVTSMLVDQEYPSTADDAFIATSVDRFLPSMIWWDACRADPLPLNQWLREPLVLAVDAGVSSDAFGVVGVSYHPVIADGVAVRYVRAWVPHDGPLDFDTIELELRAFCRQFSVLEIAYDPYQLHQMMTRLRTDRVANTVAFDQGGLRLMADKNLLDLIATRRLTHDGNADLRTHIDNADRKTGDEATKLRLVKRSPSLKIDLSVALSMSCYRMLTYPRTTWDAAALAAMSRRA